MIVNYDPKTSIVQATGFERERESVCVFEWVSEREWVRKRERGRDREKNR